jgi:hypothetical protein
MGYLFDRLGSGEGIVAMSEDGRLSLAVFVSASTARLAVALEDDTVAKVHRDATVAFFFSYLREAKGPIVIEQVTARLIEEDIAVPL